MAIVLWVSTQLRLCTNRVVFTMIGSTAGWPYSPRKLARVAMLLEESLASMMRHSLPIGICVLLLSAAATCSSGESSLEIRQLTVGAELTWEKLPLRNGSCVYELYDLQISKHYEVKISYPATIPASFSLTLVDSLPLGTFSVGRKLLNTEKIVFSTAPDASRQRLDEFWKGGVMVIVEPEGHVAMPNFEDQEFVFYNILCEEVILGLPRQAWWMALLVIVAVSGAIVASPLLLQLLETDTDVKAKAG